MRPIRHSAPARRPARDPQAAGSPVQAKAKGRIPRSNGTGNPAFGLPTNACRAAGAYLLGEGDGEGVDDGDALPLGDGVADGDGDGVVVVILASASIARCRAAESFFCCSP